MGTYPFGVDAHLDEMGTPPFGVDAHPDEMGVNRWTLTPTRWA